MRIALLGLLALSPGCPTTTTTTTTTAAPASIGQATMNPDGTIVLMLRAEGPQGAIGDAQLLYPPTHKDYAKILAHLGGIKPGESKSVAPFPDETGK